MRELGASGPSYETIVASGPDHAALPHHRPTDTVIGEGDTVIIDVGALFDGYHSDMTRTFVVGEPTARAAASCTTSCSTAQAPGSPPCAAGVSRRELDAACRDAIADGRLRRLVHPRHRPRRRPVDPRGPVRQSHRRPEIAGRGRGDRRTGRLS